MMTTASRSGIPAYSSLRVSPRSSANQNSGFLDSRPNKHVVFPHVLCIYCGISRHRLGTDIPIVGGIQQEQELHHRVLGGEEGRREIRAELRNRALLTPPRSQDVLRGRAEVVKEALIVRFLLLKACYVRRTLRILTQREGSKSPLAPGQASWRSSDQTNGLATMTR